jgi:hypothetical protein
MTDPSLTKPDELTIDASTGVFTLLNHASIKTSYTLDLVVTTTDGTNSVTDTVAGITINKVCGSSSTTLEAPILGLMTQIPNYPTPLAISSSFTSSNPACPVTTHVLLSDSDYFTLTDDGDTFDVAMTDKANAIDTEYAYMLRATADGGAIAFVTGKMMLQIACTATPVDGFRSTYSYTVPATGVESVTFPFTSAYYITEPVTSSQALPTGESCYQTFSYAVHTTVVETVAATGSESGNVLVSIWRFITSYDPGYQQISTSGYMASHNPDTLVIDPSTGVFTLSNPATDTQSYEVEITIVTTDGYNSEAHVVSGVNVETVCGLSSTTVILPSETEFAKAPHTLPVLSRSLTATSSNPTCPITSSSLHSGHSEYVFESNGGSFEITMKPESN